ncbi:MAG: hypothetical protein GY913_14965 [Proteobacteria bacterium]|nr:hypothetical protein [Pseudomonadota bacterium]MCP4918211.1 hypothetical protein [Pseudomonadota bacterium]
MLMFIAALTACGEKEETSTAAADEAATPSSDVVPDDKASQQFAKKLYDLDIKRFRPVEGDGIKLEYDSFSFSPDGSWFATGAVSVADETMECKERGTWTMETAVDSDTADMGWTVEDTSCAGREAGAEQRLQMTILDNGQFKVKFR